MSDILARAREQFATNGDLMLDISHRIAAHPELAFDEHTTAALLIGTLSKNDTFQIDVGVAGLPTAFVATAGSGDLVIGL